MQKPKAKANVNCSSVMGFNASTIVYDAYGLNGGVGYASMLSIQLSAQIAHLYSYILYIYIYFI